MQVPLIELESVVKQGLARRLSGRMQQLLQTMRWVRRCSRQPRSRKRGMPHLQKDGAGLTVAPNGCPVEGGAALPVAGRDLRVQHYEQPHGVRKAFVRRPVQGRPPIYVRTAQQDSGDYSASCHLCQDCTARIRRLLSALVSSPLQQVIRR